MNTGRPIDFICDDRFRDMISQLKQAQKEYEMAATDEEFAITGEKLAKIKFAIDDYVSRKKKIKNRISEVYVDRNTKRNGKFTLTKLATRKTRV